MTIIDDIIRAIKQKDTKLLKLLLSSITVLDLNWKSIGNFGVSQIAKVLETNKTLTKLELGNNYISDIGASQIAKALGCNETLTILDLWSNQIGDVGAGQIAKALENNKTLITLGLWGNQIGDVGAGQIAKVLETNKTLTTLYFFYNQIGDFGISQIIKSLKFNKTLTTLDLRHNHISNIGVQAIAIALAQKNEHYLPNLHIELDNILKTDVIEFGYQWREAQKLYTLFAHPNKNLQHYSVLPPYLIVHRLFPYLYDIFKDELKEQTELKEVFVVKYKEEVIGGKTIKIAKWVLVKEEVSTSELVYPQSQVGSIFLANHDRHFSDVLIKPQSRNCLIS